MGAVAGLTLPRTQAATRSLTPDMASQTARGSSGFCALQAMTGPSWGPKAGRVVGGSSCLGPRCPLDLAGLLETLPACLLTCDVGPARCGPLGR